MTLFYAAGVVELIFFASVGFGVIVLRVIPIPSLHDQSPERLLIAFGLGSGINSLILLGLGLSALLFPPIIFTVFIGASGLGIIWTLRRLYAYVKRWRWFVQGLGYYNVCVAVIVVMGLLNGIAAASPPVDIDVLNYHLSIPHLYILEHRIFQIPGIYFSYFPFTLQMLYIPCLMADSAQAAQLLHVLFGLASMVVIMRIAGLLYTRKTAILAAMLFYALTDVSMESPAARIDLGVCFYALFAFFCFLKAHHDEQHKLQWLTFSGIFAGLCSGSKYTGLIVPLLLLVLLLVFSPFPRSRGKAIFFFLIATSLIASPWYLRNFVWTGNPVFPFLSKIFGTGGLTSAYIKMIQQGNWYYAPIPRTLLNFILSPWLLLVRREAFASNRIGPLFLTYLPVFLGLRWHRLHRLKPLLVFCGLWFPFWFWTSPLVRFLFAPLGLLCIVLARSIQLALHYQAGWRKLTLTLVSLWIIVALTWNIKYHLGFVSMAIGIVSSDKFFEDGTPIEGYQYADFQYINTILRPKNLLLFGSHGLYVTMPFTLASDLAMEKRGIFDQCDEKVVETVLRERGITHIMLREDIKLGNPFEREFLDCYNVALPFLRITRIYLHNTTQIFAFKPQTEEEGP